MSKEDIDKVLQLAEAEEQTGIERTIKDVIEMYFMLEDESELIDSLKRTKAFPSLK